MQGDKFYLAAGATAFEDGTPNYLALPAVEFGLQYLSEVGIDTIHARVRCLTGWLIERLSALRHTGGAPLARIYGPRSDVRRGGTITFNLYDRHDRPIDHRDVEQRANAAGISLRTGCFCNPGGGEIALGITEFGVVAFGVMFLVSPGPGILVMPLGAMLATEFSRTRQLFRAVHDELWRLKARH